MRVRAPIDVDAIKKAIPCQEVARRMGLLRDTAEPRAIVCPFCGAAAWCREDGAGFRCTAQGCGRGGHQVHLVQSAPTLRTDYRRALLLLGVMASDYQSRAVQQQETLI